ncbi:hypothetical protein Pd630_LPD16113 (plasmid) [Rhodococcus opacus PD630]|nr:hypothetical protein Pd630_LPD16113 [Rhodococcus opacus PD630]
MALRGVSESEDIVQVHPRGMSTSFTACIRSPAIPERHRSDDSS